MPRFITVLAALPRQGCRGSFIVGCSLYIVCVKLLILPGSHTYLQLGSYGPFECEFIDDLMVRAGSSRGAPMDATH